MRLGILDHGHTLGKKALMAFIRTVSRVRVADIVKMVLYRPEFLGTPLNSMVQEAMRGPSEWSVAEREMMAAYVSKTNECEF